MTLLMELKRQRKEGIAEGITKGEQRHANTVALTMLQDHEPLSRIMRYAHLTKEQIEKIAQAHHLTLNEG